MRFRSLPMFVLCLAFFGFGAPALLPASLTAAFNGADSKSVWLFTSFRVNGEDGLHLAYSRDGYKWTALKNDQSFLAPAIGNKLMRDPCIVQAPDGMFHMVWTTGWTAA